MKFLNELFKYIPDREVLGLTKELNVLYIANYFHTNNKNVIVLTNTLYEANNIYKSLKTYEENCLLFPMDDFLTSVAVAISPDFKIKRLEVLEKLKKEDSTPHLIVTSLMGYLKFLPNVVNEQEFTISPSLSNISREIIIGKLEQYGYKREELVTTTGEYAIRGFIIDIFPIQYDRPIRIEFFGDDVETIKTFDENTQLTIETIKQIDIKRLDETIDNNPSSLLDYAKNNALFLIDENQINSSLTSLIKDMFEYRQSKELPDTNQFMYDYNELTPDILYKLNTINSYEDNDSLVYISREIINFNSDMDALKSYVYKEIKDKTIIFVLHTDNQINIIKDLFVDSYITDENNILPNKINIINGLLNKGFIIDNYIVISPYDIEKVEQKEVKYKNTIKIGRKIKSFNDLALGDYIVHEAYGVGIYNGLKTLKTGSFEKDYIQIIYLDNDKVYVPIENIDRIYKYSSKEGLKPKLNKLNSTAWAKTKKATQKKIKDISHELLRLYSSRSKIQKEPYKDFDEELKFGFDFPYTLTEDQEKTIKEIDTDLKKTSPMDRLLCGDVGYGKTEVAFRAMFKTVMNGYQVAYLCPTTILARQQYNSALERFKNFPLNIEVVSRHTTVKRFNEILEELKNGKIDIIIGTHKLLNKQIEYKNLGLLVIDEEQRFGVTHKEKIKNLKTDVNVLTLSATPIPRTLKMAMSGLRSLSILDTPPVNRYPIQTYVIEENELIIRDAIYKEMTRNGQVYMLINNVEQLPTFASTIKNLVPEANVVIAHGKMNSNEINTIMEKFIKKEYDILICTTIIETGIDIPNVNTLIIIDADRFGLSQLYQIRGRVGRSDKIAYAYLMYNPSKILSETATKRLNSIKEFTELGSGYKIAIRDLSIRGAGDLLGSEQAGFIEAVGLDLYTKMINEEVEKINSHSNIEVPDQPNKTTILNVDTHIDDSYVEDENIKIEIHKLINSIKTQEDLLSIKTELEDRFGKVNEKLEIYMFEKCIESIITELHITTIKQTKNNISITLPKELSDTIDGEKLFLEAYSINPKFQLSYKEQEITISLPLENYSKHYIYYINDLLQVLKKQIQAK